MSLSETLLTGAALNSNLTTLLKIIAPMIGVAGTNGRSHFERGFFMQKIQFHIIMSNWMGQSQDWQDSFVPQRQPHSVRLHDWRYVVGLKNSTNGGVMPKSYAQHPTKPATTVRLKSVFFLLNSRKKRIASNLHFDQIKALADQNQGSVIKFQKMEAIS